MLPVLGIDRVFDSVSVTEMAVAVDDVTNVLGHKLCKRSLFTRT